MTHAPGGPDDETLARNQPAMRTGRRRVWLIPATILAVVGIGALIAAYPVYPPLALTGIALVTGLMIAIVICMWMIRRLRRRNLTVAWLMGIMAATAIVVLLLLFQLAGTPVV